MKFTLVFLVMYMSIGANLPDGVIARLGVDPNYLVGALFAFIITGLIAHRHLALIVLVILMCIGANLPADYAAQAGINRDVMMASLVTFALSPYIIRIFE
jgi:hypothetical protein